MLVRTLSLHYVAVVFEMLQYVGMTDDGENAAGGWCSARQQYGQGG